MRRTRTIAAVCAASLCVALWSTIGRAAAPVLIAIGTINPFFEDFATETSGPLESGFPGNRLGGTGSGLAHLGGDYFVAMPDRGPNAVTYNPCTNNTTSYIPRFHTVHMTLSPTDPSNPDTTLPFTLTPMIVDTTLFSSRARLVYGAGCGVVGSGEPALNDIDNTNYFSGRSDNFDPLVLNSTNPRNGRLDPEGVRVSNDGKSVYISDEYGPYVYEFDRESGKRIRIYSLPPKFAVPLQSPDEVVEFTNTVGRIANKGMEGLAITPDGRYLVGAMQSPLKQDGGDVQGGITRIVKIDIKTGWVREYAYQLDNDKKTTISEIVAINNTDFLVDERDSKGLADNSKAFAKRIYRISLLGATEVSGLSGAGLIGTTVPKTLILDVVAELKLNGFNEADIPAKLEGLAFGEDVTINGVTKHTLYLSNDNDFLAIVPNSTTGHTSNPNRFFVFAFTDADLPGFVPQQFDCDDEHDGRGGRGRFLFPPFWAKGK